MYVLVPLWVAVLILWRWNVVVGGKRLCVGFGSGLCVGVMGVVDCVL